MEKSWNCVFEFLWEPCIALCKFGPRKLDISKTVIARSSKLGQLIEDNDKTTW